MARGGRLPRGNRGLSPGEHGYGRGEAQSSTPRRGIVGRILEADGVEPESGSAGYRRAGAANQRDSVGEAADTARRLARYFGTSPQFWLGLQMDYDLDVTADRLAERLEREVRPYAVVS